MTNEANTGVTKAAPHCPIKAPTSTFVAGKTERAYTLPILTKAAFWTHFHSNTTCVTLKH